MKKQQIILLVSGLILLSALFFFGNTVPAKKQVALPASTTHQKRTIEVDKLLTHAKERLTPDQLQRITFLENSIVRGDVKSQKIAVLKQLAQFWGDSIGLFEPYAYYIAETAKLENSEKSLTFAAHLFLNNLKTESEPAMQTWLASNAKVLFENALKINPANDSSVIGLGACYIFGNISDNPMEGITPIRTIVAKDPKNLFGQFILGLGGMRSGQFDKAIERFKIVYTNDPENLEAALNIAEAYERAGKRSEAKNWYSVVMEKVNNPEAMKELRARIKSLE